METKTLHIVGMTCQMCVKHVTKALQGAKGVSEVEVKLEPGTARVTYDTGLAGLDAFKLAVSEAGYEVAED